MRAIRVSAGWMSTECRHDLRRDERIHRLLDGDSADQRQQGRSTGLTKMPTSAASRPAEPRAHDGDDVQNAGDNAERGVIGNAGRRRTARRMQHADDAALDKRALDIAAHDARERDVQHIHGLTTVKGLPDRMVSRPSAGSSMRIQNATDQGEADCYARVHHAGADGDHARGALSSPHRTPLSP